MRRMRVGNNEGDELSQQAIQKLFERNVDSRCMAFWKEKPEVLVG